MPPKKLQAREMPAAAAEAPKGQHPAIFIVSKGRPKCNTSKYLSSLGFHHTIVIEPQEKEAYQEELEIQHKLRKEAINPHQPTFQRKTYATLEVLPQSNLGVSFVRNWVVHELAPMTGWFWIMDDDIRGFFTLKMKKKMRCYSMNSDVVHISADDGITVSDVNEEELRERVSLKNSSGSSINATSSALEGQRSGESKSDAIDIDESNDDDDEGYIQASGDSDNDTGGGSLTTDTDGNLMATVETFKKERIVTTTEDTTSPSSPTAWLDEPAGCYSKLLSVPPEVAQDKQVALFGYSYHRYMSAKSAGDYTYNTVCVCLNRQRMTQPTQLSTINMRPPVNHFYRGIMREDYDLSLQLWTQGKKCVRLGTIGVLVPSMGSEEGGMTPTYTETSTRLHDGNAAFLMTWRPLTEVGGTLHQNMKGEENIDKAFKAASVASSTRVIKYYSGKRNVAAVKVEWCRTGPKARGGLGMEHPWQQVVGAHAIATNIVGAVKSTTPCSWWW